MDRDSLPFGIEFDLVGGVMRNPDRVLVRKTSAMRGFYADEAALERLICERDDPLHYRTYEVDIPEKHGHLLFCISELQPGQVSEEFFMTKGHYHEVPGTAEIYLCLRGRGLMLMKTREGECVAEPMTPGRMVYVPPHWAHRSINTGNEPLASLCIYPAEAGHNYGDIESEGFPKRVLNRNGEVVIE